MWILKSSKGEVYYLLPGKHAVGRKDCNLILDGDGSISRKHAVIEVLHPQENWNDLNKKPVARVTDCGSKYGTSLLSASGSEKLSSDAKMLNNGDEIHFGLQWNKWKVCFDPMVVVMSSLSREEKQSVKLQLVKLGGVYINDWLPEVTHLTMSSITMTVKAICALACAKPIVSPQFWISYVAAAKARSALPKYEDFVPPLNETDINKHEVSFLVNPQRSTLFRGKTFVFFSELQFKQHGCLVRAAGGKAVFNSDYVIKCEEFLEPNIVAMVHTSTINTQNTLCSQSSQAPPSYFTMCKSLKANGKRAIPSSEIGLAILHCSIEKFCNPEYSISSMFQRNSEEPNRHALKEEILATETQDVSEDHFVNSGIVIPDSGTESRVGGGSHTAEGMVLDEDSNTELPRESHGASEHWNTKKTRTAKRVIEESDDEEEEVTPVKKTPRTEVPISLTICETPLSSRRSVRRTLMSFKETDESQEDLFADFREPARESRTSKVSHVKGEVEDVFVGFEDSLQRQSQQKNRLPSPPPVKRELSSDDENDGPPLKRLEMMDLEEKKLVPPSNSQKCNGSQEEREFISVSNIKEETADKPSFNVSVIEKSLIVRKNLSTTASISSPIDENVKNFKRFRKVKPLSKSIVPRIIGGADLVLYKGGGSRTVHDLVLENSDSEEDGFGNFANEVTRTKSSNSKSSKIPSWFKRN